MNGKARILKIIALVLMFIGFLVVGTLSHEAGHLLVNNVLGGKGMIYYNYSWTAGHMEWVTFPEKHIWLVYLGGGLLAAVFLFVFFWLPSKITPSKQDVYIEGAAAAIILTNLFYAPTELILYYRGEGQLFEWVWQIAYILAAIIFFVIYTKILIKWVVKNNHRNH